MDKKKFSLKKDGISFEGKNGWIKKGICTECAVFGEGSLSTEGIEITVSDCGVYVKKQTGISGRVSCQNKGFFEICGVRCEVDAGDYEFELSQSQINIIKISKDSPQRERSFKYSTPYTEFYR